MLITPLVANKNIFVSFKREFLMDPCCPWMNVFIKNVMAHFTCLGPWNNFPISIFVNIYWLEFAYVKHGWLKDYCEIYIILLIKAMRQCLFSRMPCWNHNCAYSSIQALCNNLQVFCRTSLHPQGKQETCKLSHLSMERLSLTYGDTA